MATTDNATMTNNSKMNDNSTMTDDSTTNDSKTIIIVGDSTIQNVDYSNLLEDIVLEAMNITRNNVNVKIINDNDAKIINDTISRINTDAKILSDIIAQIKIGDNVLDDFDLTDKTAIK